MKINEYCVKCNKETEHLFLEEFTHDSRIHKLRCKACKTERLHLKPCTEYLINLDEVKYKECQ